MTVILQHFKSHGILSFQRDGDNHAEEINDKLPGDMSVSEDLDLIDLPVPDFGFIIPRIGRVGLTMAYTFGFDLAFLGTVDLATEWEVNIDDGQVILDLGGNNDQVVALVTYKPLNLVVRKLTANAEVGVRGKLALFFGLKIFGVEAEATIFTPLPGYKITLKPSKGEILYSSLNGFSFQTNELFIAKGGICEAKGIDTGIITDRELEVKGKVGVAVGFGGGETTFGDEPFTVCLAPFWPSPRVEDLTDFKKPNLVKNPKDVDCMAVDLGVLSSEGDTPEPGFKVPGKKPAPAQAGKKEEDKQENPCNDNNGDGKTCPATTSELQTQGQGDSSDDTLQPNGSTASLQSAAQLDAFKPTDPNVSSPENDDDSTSTGFLPPAGQTEFSPTNDYTASLQPGPLADFLSSGDQTASLGPLVDQSLSENSKASLPSGSLADVLSSGNTPSPQPADPLASIPSILPSSGSTPSPQSADQFASLPSILPFVS